MKNAWSAIVAAQWIGKKGTEWRGRACLGFQGNRRLMRPVKDEATKWGRATLALDWPTRRFLDC